MTIKGLSQSGFIELKNVSVINEKGDVKIEWVFKDTSNIQMGIYKDSLIPPCYSYPPDPVLYIPDTSTKSFIDKNVNLDRVRSYIITQPGVTGQNEPLSSNKFNTIKTTLSFDTCKSEITINWTRTFKNKSANCTEDLNDTIQIKEYNIWRQTDGSDYQKIATLNDTTRYLDTDVQYNHEYQYYVEAVRKSDTSIKSRSNRAGLYTRMPYNPDFINTNNLTTSNKEINLKYQIADNSELNKYLLLRSSSFQGTYDTINTFSTNEFQLFYTDKAINPQKNTYYYYVAAVNQCNQLTTTSDTINNILITVNNNKFINNLSWTSLNTAKNIEYTISRRIGKGSYTLLNTTKELNYSDREIETYRGRDSSGRFCYRVKTLIPGISNRQSMVLSNKKCVYIKPQIFIPNAFTPNDAGAQNSYGFPNDEWRPIFSFLPQHYLLIIYNQQGKKVFESQNPEKPWRGYMNNNKVAPGGTYIYYLEVKNPNENLIKKRGRINLIYKK